MRIGTTNSGAIISVFTRNIRMNITAFISIHTCRKMRALKEKEIYYKIIILTVSVGWAYIQLGSLQFGQFLQRTFFVATLLARMSFCSSGLNLLKASWSIKFFFSSVGVSPSLFSVCCSWFCCSVWSSVFSLFSSVVSFLASPSGLVGVTCFFEGNFLLNLLKN